MSSWTVSTVRQQACPPQSHPNCHQGQPAATYPAATAAPAPLWPYLSASTRWLPATSRSPPTSCTPLRSGTRLSSCPRSRKVKPSTFLLETQKQTLPNGKCDASNREMSLFDKSFCHSLLTQNHTHLLPTELLFYCQINDSTYYSFFFFFL